MKNLNVNNSLSWIAGLALGTMWIAFGFGKVLDLGGFGSNVQTMVPWLGPVGFGIGVLIAILELLIGVGLVVGLKRTELFAASALLIIIINVGLAIAQADGLPVSVGRNFIWVILSLVGIMGSTNSFKKK